MSPKAVPKVVLAVRRFLAGAHGPTRGSHGLIAVSGGADSTALAAALAALAPARDLTLTIGHVDHGLRPTSADDARHVRDLGARLDVPVRIATVAVDPTRAVESTARRRRYRALGRMADEIGAAWIATAHTRDDQVETVLLRLVRGAGRGGLGGMRPRRGRILRPLLDATRADVRWYLGDLGITPIEDPSNADLRFARNRVRHLVVPLIERETTPRFAARLALLAERLRDEDDHLAELAAARAEALGVGEVLPVAVRDEPVAIARRIVRTWLERGGPRAIGSRHVEAVRALLTGDGGRRVSVPGAGRIMRVRDALVRDTGEEAAPAPFAFPAIPGTTVDAPSGGRWRLAFSERDLGPGTVPLPTDTRRAVFDADALAGSLVVRNVHPGDRMTVPGVGTRKLQDILVDRRVPRGRRATVPVVAAGDEIVWVPGVARSDVARVGVGTSHVVEAVLQDGEVFGLPGKKCCGSLSDETRAKPAGRR